MTHLIALLGCLSQRSTQPHYAQSGLHLVGLQQSEMCAGVAVKDKTKCRWQSLTCDSPASSVCKATGTEENCLEDRPIAEDVRRSGAEVEGRQPAVNTVL